MPFYEYIFGEEECISCPFREMCIQSAKTKSKKMQVGLNAAEYYEHSQFAKTEDFLEEYKKRAAIEWKNAEMKRFHGLVRAKGYGFKSVTLQAKLTALAVNLKRIARLLSPLRDNFLIVFGKFARVFFQIRKSIVSNLNTA